jgi:hypothetical protein
MHCLKGRQDRVMIDKQLSSSYPAVVYKKAPPPTCEEPNFLVLYSQVSSQAHSDTKSAWPPQPNQSIWQRQLRHG